MRNSEDDASEPAKDILEPQQRRPRARDKAATEARLRQAMLKLSSLGKKLSISAVAAEAGVAPSLIHHVYPAIARDIRGRIERAHDEGTAVELAAAQERTKELRAEVARLQTDIAKLASLNLSLQVRINELEARANGQVVAMPWPTA